MEHNEEESRDISLVDTKNVFNEINLGVMLWDMQHQWVAGARFIFNTYRHWHKLVLYRQDDLVVSKEGVTQGDTLSMILYALAVLPIINQGSVHVHRLSVFD
eukprot:6090082-Ditylum_brightwellii.AAC.1